MKTIDQIIFFFIISLTLLAAWSAISIGLSTDEYFHHINGLKRFNYIISFGENEDFKFRNNEFYPGLYDTISYALGQLVLIINKNFYATNIDIVMHSVNVIFSILSILGLYFFSNKIFNNRIALIACLLTLLNPFFFGHMGMNSKDVIIFFSLIWFTYYFYLYCVEDKKIIKNLLLASFFLGFGSGVRLTFIVVAFPVIIIGLIFLIKKYENNIFELIKRLSGHFIIAIFITLFLVILCWPHMIEEIKNGNFLNFLSSIVKNTVNWIDGPKTGLINGQYYEVFNTPKTYFFDVLIYRMPFYSTLLFITSFFLFFKKNLYIKNEIKNFKTKFILINFITFFSIFLALILSVNIYDNLRLFIFVIPFFCLVTSLVLYELINSCKDSRKNIIGLSFILFLISLSFYRFILLTPYQYDYVNFSSLKLSSAQNKWEHDYWGSSYKELAIKIKNQYTKEEIEKLKITNCSGDDTLLYYLYRYLGKKFIYRGKREYEANHVVIINRATLDVFNNPNLKGMVNEKGHMLVKDMETVVRTPGVKTTCPELYPGKDVISVTRNGLKISSLRRLY
jgi:hypothetical protein